MNGEEETENCVTTDECDGDGHKRQLAERGGDGVRLGVVALRYEQGIETLEGDHVDAVNRAENEDVDGEEREVK